MPLVSGRDANGDTASQIAAGLSDAYAPLYSRIEYAPVAVVSTCYRREQLQRLVEGFGFLAPRAEGLHVLGTVFNLIKLFRRARAGRRSGQRLHQALWAAPWTPNQFAN